MTTSRNLAAFGTVSNQQQSNRNLLHNGAMQVAQRGASSAGITGGNYYTADRWTLYLSSLGTWTQSVEADGPTGSGLVKSLKMLATTADNAPAASDALIVEAKIEGQDLQRIAKGTASAQQLSLSFWVKSNVTGTYIAEIRDSANARNVSVAYTISSSATWERKTVTFPADTTGTLANDNTSALELNFWLGAGTTFTSGTLGTTWHTTSANRAVGQTNLAAATNNYWQITGVQLETGPAATPFEFKPYGQELRECQRYFVSYGGDGAYQKIAMGSSGNATSGEFVVTFPVTMRVAPTLSISAASDFVASLAWVTGVVLTDLSQNAGSVGVNASAVSFTHASNASFGGSKSVALGANNTFSARLKFTAEL